jgi:hypothetical protein
MLKSFTKEKRKEKFLYGVGETLTILYRSNLHGMEVRKREGITREDQSKESTQKRRCTHR